MAKRRPSGDGMVRKRDDGRWEGRIVVGHKENGDSIFRYIYADNQKELTAKLRQNIDAYQGIDLTEQSKMTLREWLDTWLEQMAVTLRPGTLEHYRRDMENHVKPRLGAKPLTQLTVADLRKLYETLKQNGRMKPRSSQSSGLSSTTVHRIHTTLHHALKAARDQGLIPVNPADEVEPPRVIHQPMKILTEEQLNIFLTAIKADEFWYDFFYTELTTGLRRGEICGLMWTDFDEHGGALKVCRTLHRETGGRLVAGDTKTYAGTRKIVLPPSTVKLLRERKRKSFSPWIFHDPLRPEAPVNPDSAYRQLKKFLSEAGLPNIRFHDLRHTFSTHALSSGVDAKTLAGILGHTIVEQDMSKAVGYLTQSAETGDQYAQYALGKLYLDRQDREQAYYWFSRSAAQGNEYAQFFLDRWDSLKPPSIMLSVSRLLHHMGRIFQNQAPAPSVPGGARIDRKRLQQLREKKIAMGHKPDDHEETQTGMTMGGM